MPMSLLDIDDSIWGCGACFFFVIVLPTIVVLVSAIRKRLRPHKPLEVGHRCRTCGYDLRATPDRCPECGLVAGESPAP